MIYGVKACSTNFNTLKLFEKVCFSKKKLQSFPKGDCERNFSRIFCSPSSSSSILQYSGWDQSSKFSSRFSSTLSCIRQLSYSLFFFFFGENFHMKLGGGGEWRKGKRFWSWGQSTKKANLSTAFYDHWSLPRYTGGSSYANQPINEAKKTDSVIKPNALPVLCHQPSHRHHSSSESNFVMTI